MCKRLARSVRDSGSNEIHALTVCQHRTRKQLSEIQTQILDLGWVHTALLARSHNPATRWVPSRLRSDANTVFPACILRYRGKAEVRECNDMAQICLGLRGGGDWSISALSSLKANPCLYSNS